MIIEILALKELNKPVTIPQPTPVQTVQVEPKKRTSNQKLHVLKPITYKVKKGDTLNSISKARRVSVQRLWSANRQLDHPDKIQAGERLKIPHPTDKLKKRAMVGVGKISMEKPTLARGFSSSTGLDGYTPGQCTAWVAQHRYVPPGWGDASNWRNAALAAGWTVSSKPVNGAIGWRLGHVVYVEKVLGNGMVRISEQNYDWNSGIRTIVIPVSKYTYLY